MSIGALAAAARGASAAPAAPTAAAAPAVAPVASADTPKRSPLLGETARLEQTFAGALSSRRAGEAAEAILALDRAIIEWSADTLQTDDPDRARAVLYSLVHRLGEAASAGVRDPRETLAPLVEPLISLRAELRSEKAWQIADRLRDRLVAAGIELHDTPQGTTWTLRE
jgi:cysteinyl-tRNA synthetase